MLRSLSRLAAVRPLARVQARSFAEEPRSGSSASSSSSSAVRLTFATPYDVVANKESVEWVTVPGSEGVFGIYPDHVPTISELRPGVVSVSRKGVVTKYFIAGGFAIVRKGSTVSISAPEAVPLAYLDANAAKQALDESLRIASTSSSAEDKAAAEIAASVHQAIIHAAGEA